MIVYLLLLYPLQGLAFNTSACGQLQYIDGRGVIHSRTGDMPTTCNYHITSPSDWIKLKWTYFDVKGKMPACHLDYVILKSGCHRQQTIAKFCSLNMRELPHDIYAPRCMTITYRSSGRSAGFSGEYESFNSGNFRFPAGNLLSTCYRFGVDIYTSSGVIGSPYWPNSYNRAELSDSKCEWDIQTAREKRISLNIMDMDMSYRLLKSCARWDYVRLKGKKSVLSTKGTSYYCKRVPNATLSTTYYEIEIKMQMNRLSTNKLGRGFLIGFVTYEDEAARSASKLKFIIGMGLAVLIVTILTCCCYRKFRRHRQLVSEQNQFQSEPAVDPPPDAKFTVQPIPPVPYNTGASAFSPDSQLPYPGRPAPYPDMLPTNPPYPGLPYSDNQLPGEPPPYQAVIDQYPPQTHQVYPLYPPPNYSVNPIPPP